MSRGKEPNVTCEKCGRQTRRDKAVFIDKIAFSNPMERKDVHDNQYTQKVMREAAYCPSCGKHMRIYEKKKKMMEQQAERNANSGGFKERSVPFYADPNAKHTREKPQYQEYETQAPQDAEKQQ